MIGPDTLNQLKSWPSNSRATVKPVTDLTNQTPVDGYEIATRVREAVRRSTRPNPDREPRTVDPPTSPDQSTPSQD